MVPGKFGCSSTPSRSSICGRQSGEGVSAVGEAEGVGEHAGEGDDAVVYQGEVVIDSVLALAS